MDGLDFWGPLLLLSTVLSVLGLIVLLAAWTSINSGRIPSAPDQSNRALNALAVSVFFDVVCSFSG